MKKNLLLFLILFCVYFDHAQTPTWQWAKTSNAQTSGQSLITDNNGNLYITGVYTNTFTLGSYTLVKQISWNSMSFFAKIDASGNVIWCKDVSIYGGASRGIALDANNNIFIIGDNMGGTGGPFPNNGTDVVSLYKFDANGNELWSKCMGGSYYSNSESLTIDNSGNAIICGTFKGSYMAFNTTTITNSAQPNTTAFIAKYDGSGAVIWAKSIHGNSNANPNNNVSVPTGITTDGNGNIYMTGWFTYSTLVCGNTTLNNISNNSDAFIAKLDASGNFVWATNPKGQGSDQSKNIGIDNQNSLYISGDFSGANLVIGSFTLTNTNTNWFSNDLFIAKYDNSGNVLWAKSKDGARLDAMGTDANGNTFISGYLRDSLAFGNDKIKNTSFYLAKYDNNGNEIWGKGIKLITSMSGFAQPFAINQKVSNDVYVTGSYNVKKMILDQDTLVNPDQSETIQTFFLAKTSSNYVGVNEFSNNISTSIFPNPSSGIFRINFETTAINIRDIKIRNAIGQEVNSNFSIANDQVDVQLINTRPGIYFIELVTTNNSAVRKIIIN